MKHRTLSFLLSNKFIITVAVIVPLIAGLKHMIGGIFNDYRIFTSSFYYCLEQINMYEYYPELNGWSYIYGPFFTLIIAPFALLPDQLGTLLWDVVTNLILFVAIYYLLLTKKQKVIIFYFSLIAVYANAVNSQTNSLIAALIIGTFLMIRKDKVFWAACFIAIGFFIKLYGIVGFAFIFFCKRKRTMIFYFIIWSVLFFVLPMLISSPTYIIDSYHDWFHTLVDKNRINLNSANQDISIMGLVRRISNNRELSNIYFLLSAALMFLLQFINKSLLKNKFFQFNILAATLISVVLFSSGSEHCTYIIAVVGALIWAVTRKDYNFVIKSIILILILVELLASGLGPSFIRKNIIRPYSIEALPFCLIWLHIIISNYRLLLYYKKERPSLVKN